MLTDPMKKMLAHFAADLSVCTAMYGFKNADRTLGALISRGLVCLVPFGKDPRYKTVKITQAGRDAAFGALFSS